MNTVTLIEKEQLPEVKFVKNDVLQDKPLQSLRKDNLWRALMLGNNYHCKVKITFKTDNGSLNQVETTVWAITDNYILLKGELLIPIRAIVELEF